MSRAVSDKLSGPVAMPSKSIRYRGQAAGEVAGIAPAPTAPAAT